MGLVTNRVCSFLLTAVLTSTFAATSAETQWSKRSSHAGSDWIPLSAPCPSCQPNDRISSESDQVARLLTPPLPDYRQILNFQTPNQFQEQQQPIGQQFVRQPNVLPQRLVAPVPNEFPPKFQTVPKILPTNTQQANGETPIVKTTQAQFVQQSNGGVQLHALQENSNLAAEGHDKFIPPHLQENPSQEAGFTQLIAQDSQIQYNTVPNQVRNNQYQQFIGQFFQPQQPHFNLNPQISNTSELFSSSEEKPDVQLVYVPVEALNQRGRFSIPYNTASKTLNTLKDDLQLQQEPSALAAEESRQQRQQYFQPQYPTDQSQIPRLNPGQFPQLILSTEQPLQNKPIELRQQVAHEELQVKTPQLTDTSPRLQVQNQQHSLGQQLLQSLRAHPTGIPQQLPQHPQPHQLQQQVSDIQLAVPIQASYNTQLPQVQLHRQNQQITQQEPLVNQDHFLKYLRPLPTIASQLLEQQQQQEQNPSPTPRYQATQISQLQLQQPSHEDRFLQTQRPNVAPTSQAQLQQEYLTEEPQLPESQFITTQRPHAPQQQHHQIVTQPSTQQPRLESQQLPQTTKAPQVKTTEQRTSQRPTTPVPVPSKPVPHQPPLSVYMGKEGHEIKITDVIKVLKHAKTIAVLDSVGPESPQVFVGPSNLKPPLSYAKFELPYLSSIESNRVERKVDRFPFFVAPLNFNPPPGYSKIPFPAPHIGSVVVSNVSEIEPVPTRKPTRGRFSSQYSLPSDLPAINPQLPTLVNSLQDSRVSGNVHLAPTREQNNPEVYPTGIPYQQTTVQQFQQVPRQQHKIQQFQEIHQVSEAPQTSYFPRTPHTPEIRHNPNVHHVTSTPQSQHFSLGSQQVQHEQFSQVPTTPQFVQNIPQVASPPQFVQNIPPAPVPQPSQFPQSDLRDEQNIPQFGQFPSQPHLISQNTQIPEQQLSHVTPATASPQFQQFSELNQEQPTPKSQVIHENNHVTQSPEIRQYQHQNQAPRQQTHISTQEVEQEGQQQDVSTTPLPRIPKRRPSYRARQRTTEAPANEETSTTTRRPYTRGRRPYAIRNRAQQQDIQTQHENPSTITQNTQFQVDVEPSSTTEFFTGFKYSTRAPTRTKIEATYQETKPTPAQEDKPTRNHVPRTRIRTRERNSQRVTAQNVPTYQTQLSEQKAPNFNLRNEQDPVVPSHESKRQRPASNQYYNTERSGFDVPTTENSKFEEINGNLPHQNSPNDEIAYQQQLGLNVNGPLTVSQTPPSISAYQTDENVGVFPSLPTPQSDSIAFQEVNSPVSATIEHPEPNVFSPNQPLQGAERHRERVHPQLVNEEPARFPQFAVPVQVSVSGQTEIPEVEETPRPVYVRIRGHTRGRRPQNQRTVGIQQAVPKYQQQQETSESLQKNVPQEQELVYQNPPRIHSSNNDHQTQPKVFRQRVPAFSSENIQDKLKVAAAKPEESEEEYGFIRPISFPSTPVNRQETSPRSQELDYFEENRSQESQHSVEDLDQNTPIKNEQHFLVHSNRRPVLATEEPTTPATTVFTVRPSRRQNAVKQQVRVTSIRGRMRRPTTSTTEQSEPIIEERQPTSTASQFVRKRPINRFTSAPNSNEVNSESQEAIVTPRSSLLRYESPIRGGAAPQRHVVPSRAQTIEEAPSTPSTFQITLLDDPPNYPQAYNTQSRGQNPADYQYDGYSDLPSSNSENLPRYYNEDPEGGAESQWATKRLPFSYPGHDASTIAMITFTTELPSSEQIVTEIPFMVTKTNITNEGNGMDNVETLNKSVPLDQEIEQPTTEYPIDVTSKTFYAEEDKLLSKDQKELSLTQKKASDHNLDKKSNAGRRGTWVRVRKVQRPQDMLETAESQNIGALSMNQLQSIVSKGIPINSWSAPPSTETEFHEESFVSGEESVDDDSVQRPSVYNDSFNRKQTFGNEEKPLVESFATTTEVNSVTEEYRNEETTNIYVTPPPTEDVTTRKQVLQEIAVLTTDIPIIETSTHEQLTETVVSTEVGLYPTRSNASNENVKLSNHSEHESHVSPDKKLIHVDEDTSPTTYEESKDEINNYDTNAKTVEVTNIQVNADSNDEFVETTTGSDFKHQTSERTAEIPIDQVKINDNGDTAKWTSYTSKDRAQAEHLSIQSSVRDAIQQNTPTEGTTDTPIILHTIEDVLSEALTTTDASIVGVNPTDEDVIRTSMRTEVSHETEICFRGRCVKTKSADNDHLPAE